MAVPVVIVGVAAFYGASAIGSMGYKFYEYLTRKEVKVLWYQPRGGQSLSHQSEVVMRVRVTANIQIKIVRPDGYVQPMIIEAICDSNPYYAVKEALKNLPDIHRRSANVAVIIFHKAAPHIHGSQVSLGKDLRKDYPEYNSLGLIVGFQVYDKRIHINKENTESTKLLIEFLQKFTS